MKKVFTYSAISFFSLVVLLSCSKNAKESLAEPASLNPDRVINAYVAPGETYVLNIANTGGVSIYKQAHATDQRSKGWSKFSKKIKSMAQTQKPWQRCRGFFLVSSMVIIAQLG